MKSTVPRSVYLVSGLRTPFLKTKMVPAPFSASDLAVWAGRSWLMKQPFEPSALDEVILGCAMPSPDEANIARVVSLRLGCGHEVPAFTVMRNCASGLEAIDGAYKNIQLGRADLILAGGTEVMSRAPLLHNLKMLEWMGLFSKAKTIQQKASLFLKLRPNFLKPVVSLLKGLSDPTIGLSMGQTAEEIAYRYGISRDEMDEFSMKSHQKASKREAFQDEMAPIFPLDGQAYMQDDGVRENSTMENLSRLKPFFDPKFGKVTPGNSSQITDGAAWVCLASEQGLKRHGLKPVAEVIDFAWSGLDPKVMGLGPTHAIAQLLKRQSLKLDQIDAWEINEAFAAQVIGCLKAFKEKPFSQLGQLNVERLNVDGGAIAIGHPVGASGARITLHLTQVLKRLSGQLGIASLCIGGGQGGAVLLKAC